MEKQLSDMVKEEFGGVDYIKAIDDRLKVMEHDELIKFVLISANKLGTVLKGGDYEDPIDATRHINRALEIMISSYDNAVINNTLGTPIPGTNTSFVN